MKSPGQGRAVPTGRATRGGRWPGWPSTRQARSSFLYFATSPIAFIAAGIRPWQAVAIGLATTTMVTSAAVLGFREVANRLARCREWVGELLEGPGGQRMCDRCWRAVLGTTGDQGS